MYILFPVQFPENSQFLNFPPVSFKSEGNFSLELRNQRTTDGNIA